MPRRMTVPTKELGDVKVLVLYEDGGKWEPPWDVLRGTRVGNQLTLMPSSALEHALKGWSNPFVRALGIPPEGALKKLPVGANQCQRRGTCPLFVWSKCHPESEEMPWCFEPDGFNDAIVTRLVVKLIEDWRSGVYVLVEVKSGS